MSWVHNDQEGWDQVERLAVTRRLSEAFTATHSLDRTDDSDFGRFITMGKVVLLMQEEFPGVFAAMLAATPIDYVISEEVAYLADGINHADT